jgi:hypothetical protein
MIHASHSCCTDEQAASTLEAVLKVTAQTAINDIAKAVQYALLCEYNVDNNFTQMTLLTTFCHTGKQVDSNSLASSLLNIKATEMREHCGPGGSDSSCALPFMYGLVIIICAPISQHITRYSHMNEDGPCHAHVFRYVQVLHIHTVQTHVLPTNIT